MHVECIAILTDEILHLLLFWGWTADFLKWDVAKYKVLDIISEPEGQLSILLSNSSTLIHTNYLEP